MKIPHTLADDNIFFSSSFGLFVVAARYLSVSWLKCPRPSLHGMATVTDTGLTILVTPPDPEFDIVFVHGFTGHPQRTWADKNGAFPQIHVSPPSSGNDASDTFELRQGRKSIRHILPVFKSFAQSATRSNFWPQTLLPETAPSARILTFGYDTNVRHRFQGQVSQNGVYDIARDLLVSLISARTDDSGAGRPVVFVAHSLGGIVVKELLRQSRGFSTHQRHLHSVYLATRGLIFFGTPHGGSDPRGILHHVAENIIRVAGFSVSQKIVDTLLPTSERLRELRDEFGPMAHDRHWIIHSFQEQYGIAALGGAKVVEDTSSCLSDATIEVTEHIASNHMDMCRFSDPANPDYVKFASALVRIMRSNSESDEIPAAPSGSTMDADSINSWLDALWFPEMYSRENTIKPAHDATCGWLTQDPQLLSWLHSSSEFLWIMGNPGTGKSTKMKYLLDHVRSQTRELAGQSCLASFFFHNRGAEAEKSLQGLYRTLIYHIVSVKANHTRLRALLEETHLEPTAAKPIQWTVPLLQTLFLKSLTHLYCGESFICFIDALDECDNEEARELVTTMQQGSRLATTSGVRFLVCVSSRHYPHISVDRRYLVILEKATEHYTDIEKFLDTELRIGRGREETEVRHELIDKSRGSFLWVVLVVASLNLAYDRGMMEALQRHLREIPGDVADLFASLLAKETDNQQDTLNCLTWVLCSTRPLRVAELYTAILLSRQPQEPRSGCITDLPSTETMERFIVDCARGLVETRAEGVRNSFVSNLSTYGHDVQFIHETVIEFLSSAAGLPRHFGIEATEFERYAHDKISSVCLDCLESAAASSMSSSLEPYSYGSLACHAQQGAGAESFLARLNETTTRNWIKDATAWVKWKAGLISFNKAECVLLGIHLDIAPFSGANWLIPFALSRIHGLDIVSNNISVMSSGLIRDYHQDGHRHCATTISFINGVLQAVGLLSATCSGEHIHELIGFHGPRLKLPWESDSGMAMHPTLLSFFTAAGVEDIVEPLLLSSRFDVNVRHYTGRTPIVFAIERNRVRIVRLILETGRADLGVRFEGRTLLMTAILAGAPDLKIVRLLLDQQRVVSDINVSSRSDGRDTALIMAAERGARTPELVKLLLTVPGIDVNGSKISRCTPLHKAVEYNNAAAVESLLAHPDVDPNLADLLGETAAMKVPWRLGPNVVREVVMALLRSPKVDIWHRSDADGLSLPDRAFQFQVYGRETAAIEIRGQDGVPEGIDWLFHNPIVDSPPDQTSGLVLLDRGFQFGGEEIAELDGKEIFSKPIVVPPLSHSYGLVLLDRGFQRGGKEVAELDGKEIAELPSPQGPQLRRGNHAVPGAWLWNGMAPDGCVFGLRVKIDAVHRPPPEPHRYRNRPFSWELGQGS